MQILMALPLETAPSSVEAVSEKTEDIWVAQDNVEHQNPVVESSEYAYRVNSFPFAFDYRGNNVG